MRPLVAGILFSFITLTIPLAAQNTVTPQTITPLAAGITESSGLISIDGKLWTHNDSGGQPALYEINKTDGSISRTVMIQNATNVDWEDLAADSGYVYIGDFGNNSGSRTNLKIYRIGRSELAFSNSIPAGTINFSYSDQTSWDPHPNQTDFDCEGFIAWHDSLYLFSKDWVDQKTRVYRLSDQPGTHVAEYLSTFDAAGLVTGAELFPPDVLLLQGYSMTLSPFTWVFRHFQGTDLSAGTNVRLDWTGKAQTEGISYADSTGVYVTSETAPSPLPWVATLFYLDISDFLADPPSGIKNTNSSVSVFGDHFTVTVKSEDTPFVAGTIRVMSCVGQILGEVRNIAGNIASIPVLLQSGVYIVTVETEKGSFFRKILIP